ncbi:MAG: hypothetical protein IPN92_16135 [Chromatiaceae bacterium]|nr:hypothetical protein [Chromatiaceae bacterium]
MALMGAARQRAAGSFPLIGIAPRGRVDAPAGVSPGGHGSSSAIPNDESGGYFHADRAEVEVQVAGPDGLSRGLLLDRIRVGSSLGRPSIPTTATSSWSQVNAGATNPLGSRPRRSAWRAGGAP